MTRLIFAFALGLLAVQALPVLPPWWLGFAVLLPAFWPWRHRAFVLALACGFALTLWRAEWRMAERWPIAQQGTVVAATGHIASLPELSREGQANTWRFVFEPEDARLPSRIRVSLYRSPLTLRGGECWRFSLRLKSPHGSANPGGFDYEGWLFQQGIGATATAKEPVACEARGYYPVLQLRQQLRERLQGWLPGHPAQALVIALVMGDDSAVSDADWRAFRHTGTTHLIAISGFNLAIVAGLVFWLWRWAWPLWPRAALAVPAQKAAAVAAAVAAAFYALLAGFEPPVMRALLMLLVALAALFLQRTARPLQLLALAWGVIVLADPFAVLAPGTWLSFAAVAAIVFLASGRLHAGPGWRQLLWVQLGLSLLLAPLTLYWFQSTAGLAGFINLLAVPWFALLTPLALFAVLLASLLPVAGLPLLQATAEGMRFTTEALHALALTHGGSALALAPAPASLLLALLGLLLLLAPRGVMLRPLGLLCLLPLAFAPAQGPVRGFSLLALDVGQGLSVLVRTANHSLLFDTGPAYGESFDAGEQVVLPALRALGVQKLDVLLVSHADLDHAGGAAAVKRGLPVLQARGALSATPCVAGQHWEWDGVRFTVLNGPADAVGEKKADNNGGCVLRIASGSFSALLPADIEREAEARLLAQLGAQGLKADVLLAPHHGSKSSSSEAFVAAVNPELVIFSAGFANPFRHPRPEVVERYLTLGSTLHMTGHEGAVGLQIDPVTGLGPVQVWRNRWPRYWQAPWLPVPGS